MPVSTVRSALFHRSLLGCGFLLFGRLHATHAQREVELQLSGGVSLTQPEIRRHNLPRTFRTPANFNTSAALRLTFPVSYRLGLGVEQRVTGLSQVFAYHLPNARRSTGIMSHTINQSGISLRLYDLWTPGPHWGLDVALTGSYGWVSGGSRGVQGEEILFTESAPTQLSRTAPLVRVVRETKRHGTPMAGVATLIRYEWGLRHALLFTAAYQRGLRQTETIRSTQVAYVDEAGTVQQGGSFVVSSRAAYGTVQLGYGLRLGRADTDSPRMLRTPRYNSQPEEDAPDEPATE